MPLIRVGYRMGKGGSVFPVHQVAGPAGTAGKQLYLPQAGLVFFQVHKLQRDPPLLKKAFGLLDGEGLFQRIYLKAHDRNGFSSSWMTKGSSEMQTRGNYPIRVPLYGSEAAEYVSQRGSGTDTLAEMLARQTFDGGEGFARVLNLELRRMRRAGATVIITSRLTADVAEGIKHIRRMGPSARLYYVTYKPEDPSDRPYISQLLRQGVEVCYVTPA